MHRILLAEDDDAIVRLLTDSMTWTSFANLQKYSAPSGLELIGASPYKGLHPLLAISPRWG